jgi:hypothetical protein
MGLNIDKKSREFILTLFDFSGGLNTRDIDSKIRDNELSAIRDFVLDKRGALSVRPGYSNLFASEAGSDGVMSQGGFYKTGETAEHIFTSSTKIYKRLAGSTTTSVIKSGLLGNGLVFDMHQFLDKYFMGNGTDNIQVYDGSSIWDIGYPIPASNCSAAKDDGTSGGLEAKVYKYKITFYYDDGESNCCVADVSITPTSGKSVSLTDIPIGNSRVTQRRIYRTAGDGDTYKLLTSINNNTTTTYTDSIADSGLGADMDEDNNYSHIQKCCYMISHKGRMWYAGDRDHPSRLYYSKALSSEANPSLYYWDIGSNDGDIITGLFVNLGALVIFKRYSTWVITGDTPTGTDANMVLEKVNPSIGCISRPTAKHAGNDIIFLSPSQGVHRLHRIILADTESMDAQALSDKINYTLNKQMNQSMLAYAHAEVFDHKYFLFLTSLNESVPNRALVLELSRMNPDLERTIAWTQFYNMNFYSSCLFLNTDGEHLYLGHNSRGFCYEYGTSSNDDGQAINAYAITKYFDIGSFANYKVGQDLFFHGRASEDYQFTIRLFLNTVEGGVATEIQITDTFTGGGAVSGESVMYDEALYDDVLFDSDGSYTNVVSDIMRSMEAGYDFNKIKFKIEDISANNEFAWYGWEFRGFVDDARPQG